MTIESEIIELVKAMPGLTNKEIREYMPHVSQSSLSGRLSTLTAKGTLRGEPFRVQCGTGNRHATAFKYHIGDGTPPQPKRRNVTNGKSAPMANASFATGSPAIMALNDELAELRAWKADAIARYPDLAIPPALAKARKIVADLMRSEGDHHGADQVDAGKRDATMLVRATEKALEA